MIFSDSVNKGYTIKNLLFLPIRAMAPYWYLYVLIFYYLVFYQIMKKEHSDQLQVLICFMISLIGSWLLVHINFGGWLCAGSFINFSVYFSLGIYISKVNENCFFSRISFAVTCIGTTVALVCSMTYNVNLLDIPVVGIITAAIITIFIINLFEKIQALSNARIFTLCGKYSLEIYLTHCFITAANRIILIKLGITIFWINVLVNFIMATFIPVLCAYILKNIKLHEYIFRPFTVIEKRKERNPS